MYRASVPIVLNKMLLQFSLFSTSFGSRLSHARTSRAEHGSPLVTIQFPRYSKFELDFEAARAVKMATDPLEQTGLNAQDFVKVKPRASLLQHVLFKYIRNST